jgi:hypothetical protein
MNKTMEWTPSDYSPTYNFDVNEKGEFIKLNKIFDIPSCYPEQREIEIEQHYVDYISTKGFEKYKSHRKWLGDKLYT